MAGAKSKFELFVATRYLRAKRKQAVISVITVISVLGVAAGVMALVIALAINTGFRSTLQRSLLGAYAHVIILEKRPGPGIENWRQLDPLLRRIPHVVDASPSLYGIVLASGPLQSSQAVLKGIPLGAPPPMLRHLRKGSFDALRETSGMPGAILGSGLAQATGMLPGAVLNVISPQGELTPFGPHISRFRFRVVGIFESGFAEVDSQWAYVSLDAAEQVFSVDSVNAIELRLDDIYKAPEVAAAAEKIIGPDLVANTWMDQFRQILNALRMERIVTAITIGLIVLVAALNILITLIMMVMEKNRDIAILMSMGARREQIRKVFMLEGMMIGVVGTAIGLFVGYTVSFLANHYRWLRLDAEVYQLSFVPFEPRWVDGLWIAAVALAVSFIATIYPARAATRIAPVEALRYE
ncbi:MAG TPA: FtsX-like permease family protein [Bryobacteraceae bacterium]|nr:FtsX-like permease family protein [Bryobacteraceae bacterium]